jgi:hypothetical protein
VTLRELSEAMIWMQADAARRLPALAGEAVEMSWAQHRAAAHQYAQMVAANQSASVGLPARVGQYAVGGAGVHVHSSFTDEFVSAPHAAHGPPAPPAAPPAVPVNLPARVGHYAVGGSGVRVHSTYSDAFVSRASTAPSAALEPPAAQTEAEKKARVDREVAATKRFLWRYTSSWSDQARRNKCFSTCMIAARRGERSADIIERVHTDKCVFGPACRSGFCKLCREEKARAKPAEKKGAPAAPSSQ